MQDQERPAKYEIYQIRVQGHLNGSWQRWFDDLAIHHEAEGTTMLTGPVRDQAALYGLLIKMRDLGLSLLLVRPVESEPLDPSATAIQPYVKEDRHHDGDGHPSTRLDL